MDQSQKAAPEPAPDPKVVSVLRLLRPVAEPALHPEADGRLPRATRVEVGLATHRLRVLEGDLLLVDTPLSTGRVLSPTPEGEFKLTGKPTAPASPLRYGHFRDKSGTLLVRGVFPGIDPLPADAVFDAVVPKGIMQLSEGGPLIFGGEATGAATSDGSLVLPERIAVLLQDKLPIGIPIVITR